MTIYDPHKIGIVFAKIGKENYKKGHIPSPQNWADKITVRVDQMKLLVDAYKRGEDVKTICEWWDINVADHTKEPKSLVLDKPDSIWVEIEIHNGSRVRIDSMKVRNY